MGCILAFTINLRLASNRIGWVYEIGSIESIVRERLSSDIGNSPFLYVCYVESVKLISTLKNRIYVAHA